ncbi:response regulator transcription factor [Paracoccus cavernae]|uniref:response regulator transcription factor n=1 Tax=Paracoccus cavernae TaxID=1571207 RepID=UPI00362F40B6
MPNSPTDPSLTVFVVDDDADIRTSLVRGLSKRGYLVEAYESATAFLAAYSAERLGCLVLDYGMPDMNGLELQRHLNAENLPIPIIFITGHGGVRDRCRRSRAARSTFSKSPSARPI